MRSGRYIQGWVVPDKLQSKEFLSRFKTEADVSKHPKNLHSQVLEQLLAEEFDSHLGYEKGSPAGNNTGNSRNGSFPQKIQTEYDESASLIPGDRFLEFEPMLVSQRQSRGLSIGKLRERKLNCVSVIFRGYSPETSRVFSGGIAPQS